jgi:hypothetical protein
MFEWGLRFSREFGYNLGACSTVHPETVQAIPSSKVGVVSTGGPGKRDVNRVSGYPLRG